jgi:phage terminase large subunit
MIFNPTYVFGWNYQSKARYVINQGGSSSGKTYSILQVLAFRAFEHPGTIITVTSETLPTMKTGAIRDFDRIIKEQPFAGWIRGVNLSSHTYNFSNGSIIEFKPFSSYEAAKHGKRNFLFVNEANHIGYEIIRQLIMRTSDQVYIDFNPTSTFWVHHNYLGSKDAQWIYSTYRDNRFADENMVKEIEALRINSPEHYKVYGLGKRGSLEGQIFPNVNWVESLPNTHTWAWGMDFGYSNSPTTLCKICLYNGQIFGKEYLYKTMLTEPEIVQEMESAGVPKHEQVFADSANPMLIEYLRRYHQIGGSYIGGFNVIACEKTDIMYGISAMKRYRWNITHDSHNWKREQQSYIHKKDKNGGLTNTPIKAFDHLWDASRYAFFGLIEPDGPQFT